MSIRRSRERRDEHYHRRIQAERAAAAAGGSGTMRTERPSGPPTLGFFARLWAKLVSV